MLGRARFPTLLRRPWAIAIAVLALISYSAFARCEVSVQGTATAVRIDANRAPVSEVLSALAANFKVRHETLIALDEVVVSGTYSGALDEVLRRVLVGLNYVIKTRAGTVEVLVVGRAGDAPAAVASTPSGAPTNSNPAAQWRRRAPAEQKQ